MKSSLPWIVAGFGAGIVATYFLMNQPRLQSDTGYDSVDEGAARTYGWGSKARIGGAGRNIVGQVKEGIGRLAGRDDIAGEGIMDQAAGSVKNAAGTVAQAAGQTIHDLNR
ncbi:MAG TPA: CsbD family protein [Acidobacteriaceae bacterium]|jgi:uncharacterized protein YjbJ (UPF0337 family)|nr:CsbD family protein [Acidobacteriaceae bacterium]